jgi:ribosomal protein S18 acetylase RimI-like enzyme
MLRALVATPLRARESTSRFFAYGRAVESMRAQSVPEPHWYLAGIGVDPTSRHTGIATALMQPGIDASARGRVPCALLTNNEANLAFYERRGYQVVREGRTPEDGPRAWMMRREATV